MPTPPKPSVPDDDDEPITVLVLFVIAGICVAVGIVAGMSSEGGMGLFPGLLMGIAAGSGAWISAVVIRLLYRIERNTRSRR